ncbi:MAG: hypothetical protein J5I99_09150 [Verrucomicrobia bacterium]|nr:GDSL-type esterase/lipase family protein [Kiritimatiellia bacterium]MCO6401379.1 hypothetical protein [Verrucomicrobiota bacterium]
MNTNRSEPQGRGARILFRVILVALGAALLYGADRAAKRAYPRFAPSAGQRAVDALRSGDQAAESGFFVEHPYLFYTFRPNMVAFDQPQFNARAHRSPEIADHPAPGVVRILCIGGSTTASFPYVPNREDAWPGKLQQILQEKTGQKVEVINAGLTSGNSADFLAHYVFRNRYLGAQLVVLHIGGNDGIALFFDNYSPEYTHYTKGWQNTAISARPFERQLLKSALVRWLYAIWLRNTTLESAIGRENITTESPEQAFVNVQKNQPDGFRRNLTLLLRTIREDGAEPVLFPFVWAPDERFRRDKTFSRYHDALLLSFQKDRAVMAELSESMKVPSYILPHDAIEPGMFKDWCHLNADGDAIKAHFLAEKLEPAVRALQAKLHEATTSTAP